MPSIDGLTNPFENSVLNSNLTQLEKEKQIASYEAAIAQGYEPPPEVLAELAALIEAGVLSPEAQARMQALTNQIAAEIGPIITSNGGGDIASITVDENTTVVTTVTALDQYSLNDGSDSLSYSITGGDDAGLFQIDAVTGVLSFITPPDYEAPVGTDNFYNVIVQVNDGAVLVDTQALQITVADVVEATPNVAPEFVSDQFVFSLEEPHPLETDGYGVFLNAATPIAATDADAGETALLTFQFNDPSLGGAPVTTINDQGTLLTITSVDGQALMSFDGGSNYDYNQTTSGSIYVVDPEGNYDSAEFSVNLTWLNGGFY